MTDNAQAWTVYNSLMVDPLTHTVYSAGEEVHLPEMEYQLLYYFLQHPGQTLSRKTLMLAVWGAPPGLKTRTLDIHICQLRKKLKLGSSLQTVFKVGYKLRLPTNRVVSTLGDDAKTSELTETGDMVAATDQLISVYSSTKTQNAQLTSEAQTLQSENEALKAQVENLKSVLLNTYSMDEVDKVVAQGYLDEVETKRLDNLEMLDSERCEQVSSVKDLYGTTHSVSYKFDPWQEAWAKFKLDGKYDTFEANIVTSDDTNRDANMSIEIYVDDVLVGRVDDIVRDENVRPISVSVNGGKVLMIKAVNTNSAGNSYCYVSDTNLALLQ